ncbi:hypothetical protein [Streptomyces sp. NPDC050416]|uniref:hypothetical protein n=1 Tax=Streptomyces sp. NPDC050416 TaxID=3365611 RepID=UPI0037BAF4DE
MELSFYKSFIAEEIRDEGRAEGEMRRAAKDVLTVLAGRQRRSDRPGGPRHRRT